MSTLLLLFLYAIAVTGVAFAAKWLGRPLFSSPSPLRGEGRGEGNFLVRSAPLLLCALLPVVFLLPGFVAGRTPLPVDHIRSLPPWSALGPVVVHNPNLNDVALQFAPWQRAVRDSWREGEIPHRDRWNGCGTPLAANGSVFRVLPDRSARTLPASRAVLHAPGRAQALSRDGGDLAVADGAPGLAGRGAPRRRQLRVLLLGHAVAVLPADGRPLPLAVGVLRGRAPARCGLLSPRAHPARNGVHPLAARRAHRERRVGSRPAAAVDRDPAALGGPSRRRAASRTHRRRGRARPCAVRFPPHSARPGDFFLAPLRPRAAALLAFGVLLGAARSPVAGGHHDELLSPLARRLARFADDSGPGRLLSRNGARLLRDRRLGVRAPPPLAGLDAPTNRSRARGPARDRDRRRDRPVAVRRDLRPRARTQADVPVALSVLGPPLRRRARGLRTRSLAVRVRARGHSLSPPGRGSG